jgi:CheY-like chemotaxis protein
MAKILVVEDDVLIARVYKTRLEADGYEVRVAGDGREGLKMLLADKPDVMLLDLMIPKVSGVEILETIRNNPGLKNLPVLVYSNLVEEESMEKVKNLQVKEFMAKANFTPDQVVAKIKQYLKE